MPWEIELGGQSRRVEVRKDGDGTYVVTVDGVERRVDARAHGRGLLHLLIDGVGFEVDHHATAAGFDVTLYGTRYAASVIDERKKALLSLSGGGKGGSGEVIATSMPGKIVAVLVAVGDEVAAGQGIVVVEAMKMENELKAERPGVVREVRVTPGQNVEGGAALVTIGPKEV